MASPPADLIDSNGFLATLGTEISDYDLGAFARK